MHFHSKMGWPPATYDVISHNHSNWSSLNLSQNEMRARDEWTATENVRNWCFILRKILLGGGAHAPFLVRPRVNKQLKMAMRWSCMTLFTARQCFSENGSEINSGSWSLKSALCIYYVLWNLPTSPVLSLSEFRLSEFRSLAAKGIGNFHDKRPQFYNARGV